VEQWKEGSDDRIESTEDDASSDIAKMLQASLAINASRKSVHKLDIKIGDHRLRAYGNEHLLTDYSDVVFALSETSHVHIKVISKTDKRVTA
jgi:hypothetical protein